MPEKFDVAFIGGGPGGYHAAIFAAKKGLKAAIVESGELGGTCLNRGCIPTKALHACAEAFHAAGEGGRFGFRIEGRVTPDISAVSERKDAIVARLREGIAALLRGNGVALSRGKGRVVPGGIEVDAEGSKTLLEAANVVVATGSSPSGLSGIAVDHETVIDSDDAARFGVVPSSILIIGGGVIGCEFADIYSRFGSKIVIVELLPRILSTEDQIASRAVGKSFAKRGIEILTGVSVAGLEKKGGGVEAVLSDGTSRMAEKVLVSVGRRPNTAGIGIDELLDGKGFVTVDSSMKTVREGVWAAGDCIGGMMLAHVAAAEAETAIKNILGGGGHEMDYDAVPACVFTSPEVAGVGISEDEAKRRGIHVSTGRFFYQANGQALALGDDEGQIKIVAEKGGRLLGATIIGKGASSMISEIALAVAHKMKPSELYDVIHAHPTLGEATMEAAADIDGMAIHRAAQKRR